jgi:tetratricopeptide (TPR) repeat protein
VSDTRLRRRLPRGLFGALAVTALLALYLWAVAGRGLAMIDTAEPLLIGIGVGILVLPLLVLAFIAREFWLAARVQAMAEALAAAGDLPVDDLPRSPGGRIDRAAADAAFAGPRAAVEAEPGDWRAWYHLAFAYDAAGDRRRARAALRKAVALYGSPPRDVQQ